MAVDIYTFMSKSLTNVWAGVGAQLWAVPLDSKVGGIKTKAAGMPIGSFGLLYCIETKSLTTPFVVYSRPQVDAVVDNVWPEKWAMPFRIQPLGSPRRTVSLSDAKAHLTIAKGKSNASYVLNLTALQTFVPVTMPSTDWSWLLEQLAE